MISPHPHGGVERVCLSTSSRHALFPRLAPHADEWPRPPRGEGHGHASGGRRFRRAPGGGRTPPCPALRPAPTSVSAKNCGCIRGGRRRVPPARRVGAGRGRPRTDGGSRDGGEGPAPPRGAGRGPGADAPGSRVCRVEDNAWLTRQGPRQVLSSRVLELVSTWAGLTKKVKAPAPGRRRARGRGWKGAPAPPPVRWPPGLLLESRRRSPAAKRVVVGVPRTPQLKVGVGGGGREGGGFGTAQKLRNRACPRLADMCGRAWRIFQHRCGRRRLVGRGLVGSVIIRMNGCMES